MMTKFQSISNDKAFGIYPLRGYLSLMIYLILFMLIVSFPVIFFMDGDFNWNEVLKLIFFSFLIILILFLPVGIFLYHYCYNFDWSEKKVFTQFLFYKKLKMKAENIEVDRNNYKIVDKTDRFSNIINLNFFEIKSNKSVDKINDFLDKVETRWLAAIPEKREEKVYHDNSLKFFKNNFNGEFELIKSNTLSTVLFTVFAVAFIYQMYDLQTKNNSDISFINFITGIPALVFLIILSSRTVFNLNDKMIYTKFLWVIPYEKMDLTRFYNFEVTKHYTNGFYTGTSLNMLFSKMNNQTKFRNLTIVSATKKTKNFEAIMNEIKFLLTKLK